MTLNDLQKDQSKTIFGDFQTPLSFADVVCRLLAERGVNPESIVEPTCGRGAFLIASLHAFPYAKHISGFDISESYVSELKNTLLHESYASKVCVTQSDFFQIDWQSTLSHFPDPLLVIGNPPWVTNSTLGAIGGMNLPLKHNFHNRAGLEAITGKANFDISEWMLIQAIHWLNGRRGTLAVLCKTSVARKLLTYAWKNKISASEFAIYQIDSMKLFQASVDACLFTCNFQPLVQSHECQVYSSVDDVLPKQTIGFRDSKLISSIEDFTKWQHLSGRELYKWRSGIKHDCSKVMELRPDGKLYRNGLGEEVDIEETYLYPMLKTSEVANGSKLPCRYMLVPQKTVGESTTGIQIVAPKTWQYLNRHEKLLSARGSSIYKNNPKFSVFGVGDYSFSLWKVSISGFYKKLDFRVIGPYNGKCVVLDDASYFISCESKEQADFLAYLLNSSSSRAFLSAHIFWDSKRPITSEMLGRIDLELLAQELEVHAMFQRLCNSHKPETSLSLFD